MIHISQGIPFNNSGAEARTLDNGNLRQEDYVIMDPIGSGGFASILKAISKVDESFFAIKVIPRVDSQQYWQDEVIMNEINILKDLNHPSIIGFFGYYTLDYECHLVCEFAAGGDLKYKYPISEKEAKIFIIKVAKALEYLHQNRIIHRDVKLENVLLTSDSHIKLADFGLAVKTSNGYITGDCGTPHAKAPEVIRGMPYTKSVDWWALGVMLYELITDDYPLKPCM
ncbi:kinase-like domain-containing protein [Melampsora americana]|nr:kinase-like domain-containing protein [Melampsora americana]